MPTSTPVSPVAVLDLGATAIRLVIAEVTAPGGIRVLEEASRAILTGRDTFASGSIAPGTIDRVVDAVQKFRTLMDQYGVADVHAVATSAVREARNRDVFLDRVQARTGIEFEVINEAEESRLLFLALRKSVGRHPAFKGAWTLLVEVGGGSTSLTLLRKGEPNRSGVYALGAIRLRQQLDLRRHTHEVQVALLKRYIANVIDEVRLDIPLRRITHMIAMGGDVRFAASQILEADFDQSASEVSRDALLGFCDRLERLDEERIADQFRLQAVEAETLLASMLVYRTLLAETSARRVLISDASLRAGLLLDVSEPGEAAAADFGSQVIASAEALGFKYRFDREHGRHVAMLATRLFDELGPEHGLGRRERLLLEVAAVLHDIGMYVSLRAHHKHSQYIIAASQIFGLSDEETMLVSNVARYHRRGLPQRSHLPYVALDRGDRLIVNKLAAILRLANALDAEHLQKITGLKLVREGRVWVLELAGDGDLTMELLAGRARADLFEQTFGRELAVKTMTGR
ncbi:MAG TPA: Ppx/GppA phosphatase family protein [Vicinamibacterales bacterium]|nr:Ppx/GppA phosphatase family protein [Vicinamibacterales bacterium]